MQPSSTYAYRCYYYCCCYICSLCLISFVAETMAAHTKNNHGQMFDDLRRAVDDIRKVSHTDILCYDPASFHHV